MKKQPVSLVLLTFSTLLLACTYLLPQDKPIGFVEIVSVITASGFLTGFILTLLGVLREYSTPNHLIQNHIYNSEIEWVRVTPKYFPEEYQNNSIYKHLRRVLTKEKLGILPSEEERELYKVGIYTGKHAFSSMFRALTPTDVLTIIHLVVDDEGELQDKTLSKLKCMLTAGSFLFGYKIPYNYIQFDEDTLSIVLGYLTMSRRVSRAMYHDYCTRHKDDIKVVENLEKQTDILQRMFLNNSTVISKACFYVQGGYHVQKEKRTILTSRPICFLNFMEEMKVPTYNIFEGCGDLELYTEDHYRQAMTIAFIRTLGWVPADYLSFGSVAVANCFHKKDARYTEPLIDKEEEQ
jgi:hypothetical protein